jgi:hypothetical protein
LAHAFFVHNQHFFTFAHEADVEPANNSAERALRTTVLGVSRASAPSSGS